MLRIRKTKRSAYSFFICVWFKFVCAKRRLIVIDLQQTTVLTWARAKHLTTRQKKLVILESYFRSSYVPADADLP